MGNLFSELKRRNVVRVAIAYVVVSWVIMQIIDVVVEPLRLPDWTATMVLVLLLIGLPITLLFSWAFEMTPQGLKKTHEVDADDSITHSTGRKLDFIIIAALVVALGYFVWDKFGAGPPSEKVTAEAPREDVRSIAVLPFADMSPEGDQEYFSDGISEELLNVLAKVPGLRVAARTSSFQFKGKNRDVAEIAKQLRVAHIIEGSVRKSGTKLRITAQLIDAEEGFHIWSETYDRELTDIFAIQDEIAAAIVEALVERLGLTAAAAPKVQAAASTEAYEAYLLGIYHMEQRGGGPLGLAAEQFEKALKIDSDYVPAMARLAMTYLLLPYYDLANNPLGEMRAKARPLAEKALALDPDLPEAQAAMGLYLRRGSDGLAAEPYWRSAVALNPNYATAQAWLARLNGRLGRYDVELEMLEAAVRIDPLSRLALSNLAGAYRYRKMIPKARAVIERLRSLSPLLHGRNIAAMLEDEGRLAEAALAWLEVLAIDKNYNNGRLGFALLLDNQFGLYEEAIRYDFFPYTSLFATGRPEEAIVMNARYLASTGPDDPDANAYLGTTYFVAGDTERARKYLERGWDLIPEQPNKVGSYSGEIILPMIALRQDAGDGAGARDLIERGFTYLDGREAANMTYPFNLMYRGFLLLYSGQEQEGLDTLRRAVEAGYGPNYVDYFLMERFSDLDFTPIMALFEARRDIERDEFLKAVCNGGNPAPEAWTPLPETCEGYVEG